MEAAITDSVLRLAAFRFLEEQSAFYQGGVLPWDLLVEGFPFQGETVSMIGRKGIWKPRQFPSLPLSITTAPRKPGTDPPYEDHIDEDEVLHYRYRGKDPAHSDNVGLRSAFHEQTPLVYFRGVVRGWYLPIWPAIIRGDDPAALTFDVDLRTRVPAADMDVHIGDSTTPLERTYSVGTVRRRVHQKEFHRMVLAAYRSRCGVCLLRHDRLLDAGHILPDSHPRGEPIVPNGIALCKLHHAAYDADIVGVNPDLGLEIRRDVLEEKDGPMLVHGLQDFQGGRLHVPRQEHLQPDREFLAERYEQFRTAV